VSSSAFDRSVPAVRVENVSKRYRMYHERNQSLKAAFMRGRRAGFDEFWALRDVSFDVPRGSTFGIIGENGSGKSTMLKCIAKILQPTEGRIVANGSIAALLELGSGFHPELSGRENVYLNGSILGLRRTDVDARFDEIVDFAGVRQFIDQPVKNYSSGMYVRLGFSVAINVDPDILLVDEVLAVGDAKFQERCMEKFAEFRRQGKTVIIVSHATAAMRTMCDEVAWLDHGKLLGLGEANELVTEYADNAHGASEDVSGTTRWGTGEARIEQVDVVDLDGEPIKEMVFGEAFCIRMRYHADGAIDDVVVGLGLESPDGHMLWGSNTREAGVTIERIVGDGVVTFTVPSMPMQGTRLSVHASITDQTLTHTFDYVRGRTYINIDGVRPIQTGGEVALVGKWNHVPANRATDDLRDEVEETAVTQGEAAAG
jgi:ABC-2 type transport system ATP-binding protein